MGKIQSQSTSNPTSFAQAGGLAALLGPKDFERAMVAEFDLRRRRVTDLLNDIPGITCELPEGAFYAFANAAGVLGKSYQGTQVDNSGHLADYLLREARIAVVPGNGFGLDTHLRLSYATSMECIEEGLKRMQQALTS